MAPTWGDRMQHAGIAGARPRLPGSLVLCPECQEPMELVRVLPALDGQAPLAGFYCRPCHFASTVALEDA
jgi:hypothetical protein